MHSYSQSSTQPRSLRRWVAMVGALFLPLLVAVFLSGALAGPNSGAVQAAHLHHNGIQSHGTETETEHTRTPGVTGTPGTPQATTTPQSGLVEVRIIDESFSPANLVITVGTTVRWTHMDGDDTHTVTSPGNFNSGDLHNGQTFTYTFNTPGTFNYQCLYHSEMQGSIVVLGDGPTATPQPTGTPVGGTVAVDITNAAFQPQNLTVLVGTTVQWTNRDPYPHTSTSDTGVWTSPVLNQNQSYSFTFTTPGTYTYHCDVHTSMTGSITVVNSGGTPVPSQTAQTTQTAAPSQTAHTTQTAEPSHTVQTTQTAEPSHTAQTTQTAEPSHTPGQVFSDVNPTDYFYVPVNWLVAHGAISGYQDGTFRPGNTITRGQITKVLVLGSGWPIVAPATATFSDVPVSSPFFPYVETAVQHGVISGYQDRTFRPGNDVTRGQIAKIVVLARQWTLVTPAAATFTDVPTGHPFYSYVETAVQHAILSGYQDQTFRPGNNATRGQASKIIYNALTGTLR